MRGLDPDWRKSSRSNNVGACVEVRLLGATIEVRDTKNPDPTLRFQRREWERFTRGVRTGAIR